MSLEGVKFWNRPAAQLFLQPQRDLMLVGVTLLQPAESPGVDPQPLTQLWLEPHELDLLIAQLRHCRTALGCDPE
jgi:hypothetical protein